MAQTLFPVLLTKSYRRRAVMSAAAGVAGQAGRPSHADEQSTSLANARRRGAGGGEEGCIVRRRENGGGTV